MEKPISLRTQIKRERELEEQKYKEGYRYKVQYFGGTTKFFKEKPTTEEEKDAIMISNIISWD